MHHQIYVYFDFQFKKNRKKDSKENKLFGQQIDRKLVRQKKKKKKKSRVSHEFFLVS